MQSKGKIGQKRLKRWIEFMIEERNKESRAFNPKCRRTTGRQKGPNWDGTHNLPATRLKRLGIIRYQDGNLSASA